MLNENLSEDEADKKQDKKDDRLSELLEKDNQVRHAMQLLQSWGVISQINTGQ